VIHVQTVGVEDWLLWRDLRLEALQEAPYAFGSRLADWQGEGDTEVRWRARLSTVQLNVVVYLNGKAAGMVSGTSVNDHGIVELISMWVAPLARGQGVGDSLVATVIEWARGQRAVRITLDVVETNQHAVNLYHRHLFVDVGLIDDPQPGNASERQMALDLQT